MKQSLMNNVIQFYAASAGSIAAPTQINMYPCGQYITNILAYANGGFYFRLIQDGKQIFPVRTNIGSQFYSYLVTPMPLLTIPGLWIPVNPNAILTLEHAIDTSTANFTIVLVIASEDDRSLLVEAINKGFGKIFAKEAK